MGTDTGTGTDAGTSFGFVFGVHTTTGRSGFGTTTGNGNSVIALILDGWMGGGNSTGAAAAAMTPGARDVGIAAKPSQATSGSRISNRRAQVGSR